MPKALRDGAPLSRQARRSRRYAAPTPCTPSTTSSPRRCTASTASDDYWLRASSKPWLARHRGADAGAQCPKRSVHSRNFAADPRRSQRDRPAGAAGSAAATQGSSARRFPGRLDWLPLRLVQFFESATKHLKCPSHPPRAEDRRRPARTRYKPTLDPIALSRRPAPMPLPADIFKAYDIRGVVGKTLTAPIVRDIGQALGSLARRSAAAIRWSSDATADCRARARGSACRPASVPAARTSIDIGMVTTPMSYFAAHHLEHPMLRDGHRKPQSARLQRPQDGDRRRRRSPSDRDPGPQDAHRSRRTRSRRRTDCAAADIVPAYIDRIAGDVRHRATR